MASPHEFLIYGLGRSGRGAVRFLSREGRTAHWWDAAPAPQDLELVERAGFQQGNPRGAYRTVIAAPGVPIDHPDLVALRAAGAEVIGEVELAYRLRRTPIIGVTGTAGKGGTSSLITQFLQFHGVLARLGGNFDPPLLDVIDDADVAVAELSSFQLERVEAFRPVVGVITNLGEDHLDRHGTIEAYHAAKLNLTRRQTERDVLLLPAGLSVTTRAAVRHFHAGSLCLGDGTEVVGPDELPLAHHPANVAAALLAAEAYLSSAGLTPAIEAWQRAVLAAEPVPGRFEVVARSGDLLFVEDSIATRSLAVRAALERATAPVCWLVGGRDKGADLSQLEDVVAAKVSHVVAFGEDGERFAAHFGKPTTLVRSADGERVMREAVSCAAGLLGNRGTVLLAPVGTSFDLFADYKARGAAFARAAREWVESHA